MNRLWVLLLVLVAFLAGCTQPSANVALLRLQLTPARGHPPFSTEIHASDMGGGTYTFELPHQTIEQQSNVLSAVVDTDPWRVQVIWTGNEGDQRTVTVAADVLNSPPTILRPLILPGMGWFLAPLTRTLLDFNHTIGSSGATGIYDPDGDSWHIDSIEVMCSEKFGLGDSVFCPPRQVGVFHGLYQGRVIENACIIYPTHSGELHPVVSSSAPLTERIEFVEPFAFANPGSTEYFRLRNAGCLSVDLSGWTVSSDQGAIFRFPLGFRMQASAMVRVYTRSGTNSVAELYWDHAGGEVWNDTQGSAVLRNADEVVVHEYVYPGYPYAPSQEEGYPYSGQPHDLTLAHLTDWFSDKQHFIDWADEHMPSWREAYQDKGDVDAIMAYFFSDNPNSPHFPTIRSGTATITVIASDEWGAASTATFEIPVGSRLLLFGKYQ